MKLHYITIIILLQISVTFTYGKNESSCKWYDQNGRLFADSTISIKNEQLLKWCDIENEFVKIFSKQFTFPEYLRESSTYGNVIISFYTDNNNLLLESKIENKNVVLDYNINIEFNAILDSIIKINLEKTLVALKENHKTENIFMQNEKYFLPIKFHLGLNSKNKDIVQRQDDWIYYTVYSFH